MSSSVNKCLFRVLRLSGMSSLEEDGRFTVGLGLNPSTYCHPATLGPQSGLVELFTTRGV